MKSLIRPTKPGSPEVYFALATSRTTTRKTTGVRQGATTRGATLLAAVIEGLMMVGGKQDINSSSTRSLLESAEALAFRIALGDQAFFPEAEPSGKVLVSGCEAS